MNASVTRCWELARSNNGREFGWFIEYEDRVVGKLDDAQFFEMFWDSYRVTATAETTEAVIRSDDDWGHWSQGRFRYRNIELNEYANSAFCGGGAPFIKDGRILMRGLYLLPRNWFEKMLLQVFHWIPRKPSPSPDSK